MSIIEVPKVKLGIHPVRVARNGVITSGPAVALLASQLNMIVNRRLKVHFRNWLPVGRVTNALRLKPGQDRIGTRVGADRTRARPDYPRSFGE